MNFPEIITIGEKKYCSMAKCAELDGAKKVKIRYQEIYDKHFDIYILKGFNEYHVTFLIEDIEVLEDIDEDINEGNA